MKFTRVLIALALCFSFSIAQTDTYKVPQNYRTDTSDKEATKTIHQDLYNFVVLNNAQIALEDIEGLTLKIKEKKLKESKEFFDYFVSSWKRVEAFYILGELNEDYLDTPRYIDIFHQGNEDIKKQLDLILSNKDDLELLLYKNSHKSINALEYILFTKDINDARVNKALSIITNALGLHIQSIYEAYKKYENDFYADDRKANAMIINALIESSYKLKEWRVADVAGLSRKYKNKPDIKRSEYFISKNSQNAIRSILLTYKDVMDSPKFEDFGDYFASIVRSDESKRTVKAINKSLDLIEKIQNDDLTKAKDLYKSLRKVHTAFYIYLIDALKMNAKILDADGD